MQLQSRHPAGSQPSLRGLKALVAVLGVLIVLGTALVVGVIIQRFYARPLVASTVVAPIPAAAPGPPQPLRLPAGSRIAGIAAVDGGIVVWVEGPAGGRVILLDPHQGRPADLVEAPPR